MTVYLSLGSNLGDRVENLSRAIASIKEDTRLTSIRCSTIIVTEPWGFVSTNSFLNMAVAAEYKQGIDPFELLDSYKKIERNLSDKSHRDKDGGYLDRVIDIDIIAIDDIVIDDERLKIPHPLMQLRNFVLEPLAEIAPKWTHPLSGLTAAEMLKKIKANSEG